MNGMFFSWQVLISRLVCFLNILTNIHFTNCCIDGMQEFHKLCCFHFIQGKRGPWRGPRGVTRRLMKTLTSQSFLLKHQRDKLHLLRLPPQMRSCSSEARFLPYEDCRPSRRYMGNFKFINSFMKQALWWSQLNNGVTIFAGNEPGFPFVSSFCIFIFLIHMFIKNVY